MTRIWLSLVYKEWHEQKWKLLSLIAIPQALLWVFALDAWHDAAAEFTLVLFAWYAGVGAYVVFAPAFLSMGLSAAEHSSRTIDFSLAQPVPRWKLAAARLAMTIVVLLVPLLLVTVGTLGIVTITGTRLTGSGTWASLGGEGAVLWIVFGLASLASVNLLLWCSVSALDQRTEFRAGLIALVVTTVLLVVSIAATALWDNPPHLSTRLAIFALYWTPAGMLSLLDILRQDRLSLLAAVLAGQVLTIALLCLIFIRRYAREGGWLSWISALHGSRIPAPRVILRPPLSGPNWALLWMQSCESVPAALAGLGISLAGAALWIAGPTGATVRIFIQALAFMGGLVALVIGVGSYVHQLEPKLHAFWRSRPISPRGWFWVTYAGGLLPLILFIHLPMLLASHWRAPVPETLSLYCLLPLHWAIYSLGVLCACGIRHPVYSTILAACAALILVIGPEVIDRLSGTSVFRLMDGVQHFTEIGRPELAVLNLLACTAILGGVAVLATLAAAVLVRRDLSVRWA